MIKKIAVYISFLCCLAVTAGFFGSKYYIPENINFIAGETQEIKYSLPLKVSLYNEDNIIVSGSEPEPVKGNIKIDLSEKTEITPVSEGTTIAKVSAFGIPLKNVSVNIIPQRKVIPCGTIIGVVMKTEGILVLGTGGIKDENGEINRPSEGKIKSGDIILSCNGKVISEKEELMEVIKENKGDNLNLKIKRNEKNMDVSLTPSLNEAGEYKIGAWIRDSTQGLGTITYIDEKNMTYGALGHGVYDVDTRTMVSVAQGVATLSDISGIKKGISGEPGEVCGALDKSNVIGTINKNTEKGVYGNINSNSLSKFKAEPVEVAVINEIKEGPAVILSDILDKEVKEYSVNIESVNKFTGTDKGMIVRITDKRLLDKTGGIIQGMSGSPIIQNGKLIGAVTHVFVKDSTKGYGIFIENMLNESDV